MSTTNPPWADETVHMLSHRRTFCRFGFMSNHRRVSAESAIQFMSVHQRSRANADSGSGLF